MESLNHTEWDVVIEGTGLQQSLLALALSRSGKKILHVDDNDYYGGSEAAFSLQEAEEWADRVKARQPSLATFTKASLSKPETAESDAALSLSRSRAYSLELSPQIIYTRSSLLQHLVSSRVFRTLDFLPVGHWWVFSPETPNPTPSGSPLHGTLLKVPSGREDVFQDQVLDFKAKRALMKFLRFISDYEEQPEVWEEHRDTPFPTFLSEQFKVSLALHAPLLALTLSPRGSNQTTTGYSLPRIAQHLRSIGVFGPGFGAVHPKFGGLAEIIQVACRSCAVGGGIYVLGKGVTDITSRDTQTSETGTYVHLKDGDTVTTQWVVREGTEQAGDASKCCRSMSIVSSPLEPLFPPLVEGAHPPQSATVVVFPSGSLSLDSTLDKDIEVPPVHVFVHSSDSGECPAGQSVLYASTSLDGEKGFQLLEQAVNALLSSVDVAPTPTILWSLHYEQGSAAPAASSSVPAPSQGGILELPCPSLDPAFDDSMLDRVKDIWQKIMGGEAGDFMVFEDREQYDDDDEE